MIISDLRITSAEDCLVLALIVVLCIIWVRLSALRSDVDWMQGEIDGLNRIIKQLQAKHGMRADGIDKR